MPRRRSRKRATGKSIFHVKAHSRSPRGPDTKGGKRKPRPRVRGYSRGAPRR